MKVGVAGAGRVNGGIASHPNDETSVSPPPLAHFKNDESHPHDSIRMERRSQISIATGRRGFLEENLTGSPKAEARTGAVIE